MTRPAAPGLIVGGASKSGTTALYHYLRQHPELCLPRKKELHYFSRPALERSAAGPGDRFVLAEIPSSFEAYRAHFGHCGGRRQAVDISPSYLFHHQAAVGMRRLLPDARILFVLRNPADKAFAQYLHLAGAGREKLRFEDALALEQQRADRGFSDIWLYRRSGFYADALEHYAGVFGPGGFAVFYHEELRHRSRGCPAGDLHVCRCRSRLPVRGRRGRQPLRETEVRAGGVADRPDRVHPSAQARPAAAAGAGASRGRARLEHRAEARA